MKLSCRESGLECDYVAEGNTQDEVLKNISRHAVYFHNMRAEDIYEQPLLFTTDITDKEDLEEIKEIAEMLNPNEEVFVVARQSRLKPGGSAFTPNIVFGTDRRIIIKDPSMLGLRENVVDIPYDMISSVRLDKGVFSSNVILKAPGLISSGRRGNYIR